MQYFTLLLLSICCHGFWQEEPEVLEAKFAKIRSRTFEENLSAVGLHDKDFTASVVLAAQTGRFVGSDYLKAVLVDPRVRAMHDTLSAESFEVREYHVQLLEKEFRAQLRELQDSSRAAAEDGYPCAQHYREHALRAMLFLMVEFGTNRQLERSAVKWCVVERSLRKEFPKVLNTGYGHLFLFNIYVLKLERKLEDEKKVEAVLESICSDVSKRFEIPDLSIPSEPMIWVNPQGGDEENQTFRHLSLDSLNGALNFNQESEIANFATQRIREVLLPEAKNCEPSLESLKEWLKFLSSPKL